MRNRIAVILTTLAATTTVTAVATPASATESKITAVVTTFQADHRFSNAVTYDTDLVPAGALAGVGVETSEKGTVTELEVRGLVPNREYGAHVHVKRCGATGEAAGPHYQHVQDPKQPSTDPAYANPENEIWLDFTTDAQGAASTRSEVAWTFGDRRPASLVVHEHRTSTAEGKAGTAGARLACVNVSF
ncbi:superoxide dismutase family protein [Saccharomonospora cyanea]|uniref:Copper/zinc superoxide dismutase (SODC) n=1 Tax=Saccharomonospora cyanea NA-134 TaxID=882082 RepID=H5XNA8_9PSEU|nr:superoxide dismutase family protein [Saccharomonospora cyanea]EHR63741.1 Copper/zinc superoxide dismutase (SODC) [Saccharomonospora cyanea NA-134]